MRRGDRVWKAPEDPVATCAPDNVPVTIKITPTGLIAPEPVEPLTNLQKEIEVRMAGSGTAITVSRRITNGSLFTLEFAPWALTMMAPGGTAVSGFPPRGKHSANLEATNPLVMYVGLYQPCRPTLAIYAEIPNPSSGAEQQRSPKARYV